MLVFCVAAYFTIECCMKNRKSSNSKHQPQEELKLLVGEHLTAAQRELERKRNELRKTQSVVDNALKQIGNLNKK